MSSAVAYSAVNVTSGRFPDEDFKAYSIDVIGQKANVIMVKTIPQRSQ